MGMLPVLIGTAENETNWEESGATVMFTNDVEVAEPGEQSPSVWSICTATYCNREHLNTRLFEWLMRLKSYTYMKFFRTIVVDDRGNEHLLIFLDRVRQSQRHKDWLKCSEQSWCVDT